MKKLGRWLILILAAGLGANVGCRSNPDSNGPKGHDPEPILGSLDAPRAEARCARRASSADGRWPSTE